MIFGTLCEHIYCEGPSSSRASQSKATSYRSLEKFFRINDIDISLTYIKDRVVNWLKDKGNKKKVINQLEDEGIEVNEENIRRFAIINVLKGKVKNDLLDDLAKYVMGKPDAIKKEKKSKAKVGNSHGDIHKKIEKLEKTIGDAIEILYKKTGPDNVKFVKFIYSMVRQEFEQKDHVSIADYGESMDKLAKFYADRMSKLIGMKVAEMVLSGIEKWSSGKPVGKSGFSKGISPLLNSYAVSNNIKDTIISRVKKFVDTFESEKLNLEDVIESIASYVETEVANFYEKAWADNGAHLEAMRDEANIKFTADLTNVDPDVIRDQIANMS